MFQRITLVGSLNALPPSLDRATITVANGAPRALSAAFHHAA
jgi:hypothetical protein